MSTATACSDSRRRCPAASLTALGPVPIKELRDDRLTELDLENMGLGLTEGAVLGVLLSSQRA